MRRHALHEWRQLSAAQRNAAARSALLTPALLALTSAWLNQQAPLADATWIAIGVLCLALGAGAVASVRGTVSTALAFSRFALLVECALLLGLAISMQASVIVLAVVGAVLGGVALGLVTTRKPALFAPHAGSEVNSIVSAGAPPTQPLSIRMTASPPTRGVETAAFSRHPQAGPQLPEFDDSVLVRAASALAHESLTSPQRAHDRGRHLLAELDAALRAGPLALVNWLGAFAFVNEHEQLSYEPQKLATRFEAAGFAPVGGAAPPVNDSEAMRLWLIGTAIGHWRASQRLPAAFGRTVLQFAARNGSISGT